MKWWKLAAKQGYAKSQSNLGVMYSKGEGVPQNDKTAVKWYKLPADQGYALAQTNLGAIYHNGKGVPQDYKTAVKWCRLAAMNGNKSGAKLQDDFEKKMTPAHLSTAQKLTRECVRKKYKGC